MAINNFYPKTSPYAFTPIANGKFLEFLNYRPIPKLQSDVFYEIPLVYEYRPDLLAYDLYQDSRLWWVFAARNPNRLGYDPYFDFKAGLKTHPNPPDAITLPPVTFDLLVFLYFLLFFLVFIYYVTKIIIFSKF